MGTAQHIGLQGLAQGVVLQQYGQSGQRALRHRGAGQAVQGGPQRGLPLRADRHAFLQQARLQPLGGPGAVAGLIDARQRLEGQVAIAAQVVVLAAQAQHRRPQRAAHVEEEQTRTRVATKLHSKGRQQHRLAHAGGAGHQGVADIADVGDQAEGRGAVGAGDHQRRAVQVLVAHRAGPHRRERHQVGQVEGGDQRLADVGVGVAGDRRQPGLHRVEALGDGDKAAALDHPLDQAQFLIGDPGVAVADRHGGRHIAEGDLVGTQLLQRRIGVAGLVRRVAVEQRAFLLEDRLAQQRQHTLAFGEPLPTQAHQLFLGFIFVQADEAGRPAIGETQAVQIIQHTRPGRGGKAAHRQHAQVLLAQPRREAGGQRAVGQQGIQVKRHFRHGDPLAVGRYRGVQVAQGLAVVEPGKLRHHSFQQVEETLALGDEGGQPLAPVDATLRPVLIEQAGGAGA